MDNGRIFRYEKDRPIALYPSIMLACGVHEAVIVSFLQEELYGARGFDGSGDDFVKRSIADFERAIPFLTTKEIKRAITSIVKQGVVNVQDDVYSINWDVLSELRDKEGRYNGW